MNKRIAIAKNSETSYLNAVELSNTFLEKYNKSNETITLFGSTKYMIPYATYITVIWAVVLLAWYLIGLPIGINTLPGVTYGA